MSELHNIITNLRELKGINAVCVLSKEVGTGWGGNENTGRTRKEGGEWLRAHTAAVFIDTPGSRWPVGCKPKTWTRIKMSEKTLHPKWNHCFAAFQTHLHHESHMVHITQSQADVPMERLLNQVTSQQKATGKVSCSQWNVGRWLDKSSVDHF